MTIADFPGAPERAEVSPEGWLLIDDEAWTAHEWSTRQWQYRPKGSGRPGRPRLSHCKRGHRLAGANLYHDPTRRRRECRSCMNLRARLRYAARTAA